MSTLSERGHAIQRARERFRLTQPELADAVGISKRTIGRIEAGQGASTSTLEDLEYYLHMREDVPQGYAGQGRAPLPPETTPVPAPPPVPRALAEYSEAALLAELLRRAAERSE